MSAAAHPQVIEAAGGIVWRHGAGTAEVAVVHRPRYQDWSLPKGKREPGESWQETALREVLEETGCRVVIERFADGTIYSVKGRPKVVLFWHMRVTRESAFEPNEEVDQLDWLTPEAAILRLDYGSERRLLAHQTAAVSKEER